MMEHLLFRWATICKTSKHDQEHISLTAWWRDACAPRKRMLRVGQRPRWWRRRGTTAHTLETPATTALPVAHSAGKDDANGCAIDLTHRPLARLIACFGSRCRVLLTKADFYLGSTDGGERRHGHVSSTGFAFSALLFDTCCTGDATFGTGGSQGPVAADMHDCRAD